MRKTDVLSAIGGICPSVLLVGPPGEIARHAREPCTVIRSLNPRLVAVALQDDGELRIGRLLVREDPERHVAVGRTDGALSEIIRALVYTPPMGGLVDN